MKKRAMTLLLALCMIFANTMGTYAAATDGTTSQIAAEEELEEAENEEAYSVEDESIPDYTEEIDNEEDLSEEMADEQTSHDQIEDTDTDNENSEGDEEDVTNVYSEQDESEADSEEESFEENSTEETETDSAKADELPDAEYEIDSVENADEGETASAEVTEIFEDIDVYEAAKSAMDQITSCYVDIDSNGRVNAAISEDKEENIKQLIAYILESGTTSDDVIRITGSTITGDSGMTSYPVIAYDPSKGVLRFELYVSGYSSLESAYMSMEYDIDSKQFSGINCTCDFTNGYSFHSKANIDANSYTPEQALNFNYVSGEGFEGQDSIINELSNGIKDLAFYSWEDLLIEKADSCLYAIGFSRFMVDDNIECTLSSDSYVHTGNAIEPSVTVAYLSCPLKEGTDYELSYENNINVGIATVNIRSIDGSFDDQSLSFSILPAASKKVTVYNVAQGLKVTWLEVEGATRYYVYRDGELIKTTSGLVITDGDVKYQSGKKFTYKVVATAKDVGDSPVSRTSTYYRLMPVGIKSLKNTAVGKMTVTYDKSPGSSGYVVRYGLKSDMSDAKVITVKGQNTLSRTFSGMKALRTYYVQVRTYKIENGIRYYSGYCTTKSVKITIVPFEEISFDDTDEYNTIPVGFTRKTSLYKYPSNANESRTYTSSNPSVAKINSSGVIKGLKKGKAKITVKTQSGKKDSFTVKIVDNVKKWDVSYDYSDYDYGEPTVAPIKMYYSGNKLIFEALVANNRMFTADKFDYITITLYDSKEKQIAKKKFTNYRLNMGRYCVKKVTFTFDSAKKADIIDGDYYYDYWYTYSY